MISPGTVVDLTIEKPAAGGRMIARHDGQVVLVHAAIPGERVRAVVERRGQGVLYATTLDVLEPSTDRRSGIRDWACGGSVYAHIDYRRQLALKADIISDGLARIGKITLDAPVFVTGSPEEGYRMRARLHVRGRAFGYFREGTHGLCDPMTTRQLLPDTGRLIGELAEQVRAGRLDGVTEIELGENVPASERALHLELSRPHVPAAFAEIASLPTITGVSASFGGTGRDRQSTPRRTVTAGGAPSVFDSLELVVGGTSGRAIGGSEDQPSGAPSGDGRQPGETIRVGLRHHAQAFFQSNRFLLGALASRVVSLVPTGPVVDLYAGVGLFSASLAACGRVPVTAVEGDSAGAADLRANAVPFGGALDAVEMAVEHHLATRPVAEEATIVLDPPRTGMSKQASAAVTSQKARRLVYVSCDVATFARDARRLLDAGYRLSHLEAFDLFPNTAHVESLALFERV